MADPGGTDTVVANMSELTTDDKDVDGKPEQALGRLQEAEGRGEQQRDEALQMNAALARRVVLERVEADRAAAAATAVAWASQDPEGYVI